VRAYITAERPVDVASDVERWSKRGCRSFVLRRVSGAGELGRVKGGGVLDLERLGAARYAAGLQADVELEGDASALGEVASR
jgi:hypothetical protein